MFEVDKSRNNIDIIHKMFDLKMRAKALKNCINLRHIPSKNDIVIANNNSQNLSIEQYKAI